MNERDSWSASVLGFSTEEPRTLPAGNNNLRLLSKGHDKHVTTALSGHCTSKVAKIRQVFEDDFEAVL